MTQALGAHAFGGEPLAGDPLHDPPTVEVTPLGVVSTGGPEVTIQWVFSQPQGDLQEQYRVQVLDDALAVTHYDSGWLFGTDSSLVLDWDAEGIDPNSADLTVMIEVRGPEAIGTGEVGRYQDDAADPFEMAWGNPHATFNIPTAGAVVIAADPLEIEWTFTDDDGANTQGQFRARLTLQGTGLVLWDTGWIVSTATTYEFPVILNPGSRYTVEVQLKNNHGIRSD